MIARHQRYWLAVLLAVAATGAMAAAPKEALVTREEQDLYRAGNGSFYIRTVHCSERVYGDRVTLRLNIGFRGGMMTFRNGHTCVIDKLLREVDPNTMQPVQTY